MPKIKCLIIDDEPIAQRILEGYIADLHDLTLVGKCNNALEAREVLRKETVNLMLLDIEMPKLKGLSFVRTLTNPPAVIITTAHREFALEGYELEILDYLLKPISFERFLKAINRYKKNQIIQATPTTSETDPNNFLYVKSDRKTVKINFTDILYIEGMSNYIKIHAEDQVYVVYASLSKILLDLDISFIRIHKSFIINKYKVQAFTNDYLELGGKQLPIGKSYQREVVQQL
ncbi:MAG: DNA-binding response regulator [Saprospiraceae bacterium]|nr:MAG: DNA-binding response regulator [Saprospiraceae bacterium]